MGHSRENMNVILEELATFMTSSHQDDFLQDVTEFLFKQFDVDYVHIGLLEPDNKFVKVVAGVLDAKPLESTYLYELYKTPSHHIIGNVHKCYSENVQKLFPEDSDLQRLSAQGYVGEPINSCDGNALGVIAMVSRQPLYSSQLMTATLKIISNHITQRFSAKEVDIERRRYKHIMQSASNGIIIHDKDYNIAEYNVQAQSMLGYSDEEMLGLKVFDFDLNFSKDKIKQLAHELQKAPISFETLHSRKDGTTYYALVTANLILIEGEPFFYTSIRDISKEKSIQIALKENENLLKTVIDEMPDMLVVKDEKAQFVLANRNVATFYNTTPHAMAGKDDGDFGVPQNIAKSFKENVLSIMEKGKTEIVFEDSKDAQTGELRHFKSIKKPFKTSGGKNRILVIAQDITEQIEAKEKIEEEHAKLNTILQTTQDAFWLVDNKGFLVDLNLAMESLYGYTRQEALGMHVSQLDMIDDMEAVKSRIQEIMKKGSIRFETKHISKQGRIIDVEVSVTYIAKQQLLVTFSRDITTRKEYQVELTKQRGFLHTLVNTIPDLIWLKDTNGIYLTCNKRFEDFFGASEEKIIGKSDYDFVDKELADAFKEHDTKAMQNNSLTINEEEITFASDGHKELLQTTKTPMYDDNGTLIGVLGIGHDITERKVYEKQLQHIAHYDALTGLPNRLLFSDRLHQAISQANRQNTLLAIAYLDLDGFKAINDVYGHDIGDRLLVSVSHRLKEALREEDILARLGGDEFVSVLVDLNEPSASILVLKRMLQIVKAPVTIDNHLLEVSVSIGVTFYRKGDVIDADQLVRQSDMAMYEAKQSGKNRFRIFDVEYDKNLRTHYENIERIKEALYNNEFVLYYQPKVNIQSGKVIGLEALVRWQHPQKGLLSPDSFLPAIDNHLLIVELGYWVIETAMKQITLGCNDESCFSISVNVHALQLQQPNFVTRVKNLLLQYPDVIEGMIEFEILETSALEDMSNIKEIITECKALGINFSLDDFGTGYSSLTYLKQLPVDILKIDRSFVMEMLNDEDDHAIVKGIVDLSKTFKRKVIAEGVETVEHCKALLALGCENAQGYVIAKPMHPDDLKEWIQTWNPNKLWQ